MSTDQLQWDFFIRPRCFPDALLPKPLATISCPALRKVFLDKSVAKIGGDRLEILENSQGAAPSSSRLCLSPPGKNRRCLTTSGVEIGDTAHLGLRVEQGPERYRVVAKSR